MSRDNAVRQTAPLHGGAAVEAASRWRGRIRLYAILAPLLLLLVLWIWVFWAEGAFKGGPSGKSFGADFAMFYTASQVMKEGGNPYDHNLLYRRERALMQEQGLRMTNRQAVVRVGNPPLFFWALEPLTDLRFQPVAYVWLAALYLLSLAGFLAALYVQGWRRRILPSLIFLLMPETILGMFYGNVVGLVFAAIAASLVLMQRQPLLAGALLTVAWLKPPVALPIVLLLFLFHSARFVHVVTGFAAASALLFVLTLLATGWHGTVLWLHGLLGYSHDMGIQPDVASLNGLYVRWAPENARLALEAVSLLAALVLTAVTWWKWRGHRPAPLLVSGWLWFAWLLATPYAHFFDLMLLAVPMIALLGRDGRDVTRWIPATALYLMLVALFFINPTPSGIYLLPIPVLIAGILAFVAARRIHPAAGAAT